jgi:hypothetical protein
MIANAIMLIATLNPYNALPITDDLSLLCGMIMTHKVITSKTYDLIFNGYDPN